MLQRRAERRNILVSRDPAQTEPHAANAERRGGGDDRRKRVTYSLIIGSFKRRRRGPRRPEEASIASTDHHHPRWLAVSLLILLLSAADAMLTLTLLGRGASEANPLMASMVNGDARSFATLKVGFTALGVVLLTLMAQVRAFGRLRVSGLLYGTLVAYAALVVYEIWLLRNVAT